MSKVYLLLAVGMMSLASLCFAAASEEQKAMPDKVEKATNPVVLIKTSKGDIKVELYADKAPATVKNFLQYVDEGQYNHTIFHRVINGFMIQGGGFTQDMKQKATRAPIQNEADNGLKNERGTLAMARTSDPHSASAQFFINVADNAFLNFRGKNPSEYGYAVFGKVVDGMDVVDAIKQVKTSSKGPHENVPVEPVEIIDIKKL